VNTPPDFDDGTTGTISIQLFGTEGASALRPLSTGIEPGRNSTMEVTAKDVGRIRKIKLSTESTDGWHCNTVDIVYGSTQRRAHFDVHAWVQAPMAKILSVVADVAYSLLIKTANENDANTDGAFSVNIYGSMGVTRTLSLPSSGFQKDAISRFTLHSKDVGELTKLRLSTLSDNDWKCKDVTITKEGKVYPFSVDRWVQYPLAATVDTNVDIKYSFTIVTGNEEGSDTTAMVYITLYGTRGQSRYLPLKTGFLRDSTEAVTFKTQDVGHLTRIKLTSTSTDNWYCKDMTVQYKGDEVKFRVDKWLVYPESDNLYIDRE